MDVPATHGIRNGRAKLDCLGAFGVEGARSVRWEAARRCACQSTQTKTSQRRCGHGLIFVLSRQPSHERPCDAIEINLDLAVSLERSDPVTAPLLDAFA